MIDYTSSVLCVLCKPICKKNQKKSKKKNQKKSKIKNQLKKRKNTCRLRLRKVRLLTRLVAYILRDVAKGSAVDKMK
jgi:hypothetical protein